MKTRVELAEAITSRLNTATTPAAYASSGTIRHCVIDDLLPEEDLRAIDDAFPHTGDMMRKRSLREDKYVAAQMDRHDPLLEEIVFAFQQPDLMQAVERITGIPRLEPDEHLYAGGISTMCNRQFLNPHLDNSHDKDRQRWRVLNLLFYVSREWGERDGGHLQLWPNGLRNAPTTVYSIANRLVIMETHGRSWHSVTRVTASGERRCVSNYYFAPQPARPDDRPHVTSFRNPNSVTKDLALRLDKVLRKSVRTVAGKRIENPHVYKRS